MLLGISSFTYGWSVGANGSPPLLVEEALISRTLAFGLRCLQLGDNMPLHAMSAERLEDLKKELNQNNIRLEVGARKLTEEHLDRYIIMTAFFQAPLLRFVIDGVDYEPAIDTIRSIIRNALPDLKKNKITLGIENHDRLKAVDLRSLMENIADESVGICLDSVNSLGAGEGIEWVTETLAPYTVNFHIKDFLIKRFAHHMGFTVTGAPAGKGMLDLRMVMEKLSQYKRCKSAILEQWVPAETSQEQTIRKEIQWAEESIQFLKLQPYFNP